MSKISEEKECYHLIKDGYYCSKCGTLYFQGVRIIFFHLGLKPLVNSIKTL